MAYPLGRCASTEEIAQAALYLASNSSAFITGLALTVDGGASLGY
ncbi:SDR family oxidoreductase [Paenibacillus alba]|nr:SDR family oxidoreductase [Paenibacillus alba]